jgi:hypothetical protein
VAIRALDAAENNPGRLPCPQAWGDVGSANEGRAAAVCAATTAGWLPWRTLGLPAMLDASGRQLWYVVSPGWHLPSSGATLAINSNTPGQLSVDGRPAVALLIAPGAPLNIAPNASQLAAGCVARNQSRALAPPAAIPNPRDFLDCQNGTTADGVFTASVVDNAVNPVFNDQIVAITTADLLPALEAAIAKRIERDIVPPLKSVYAGSPWALGADNPIFPFAAPFGNPGTSNFQGAAGTFHGLLPFNQTQGCSSGARCLPSLIAYAATPADAVEVYGHGSLRSQSCEWRDGGDTRRCEGEYRESEAQPWRPIRIEMSATFTDVAMGLRAIDAAKMEILARDDSGSVPWQPQPVTYRATMNANGSATITFGATLPNIDAMGWGSYAKFRIQLSRAVIADHALLGASAPATGWFVRNEWYRLVYYATAPGHAASGAAPRSCDETTPTCLQIANLAPANKQRAILVLAGRSLGGAARPNGLLEDFLEGTNAHANLRFEQRAVNPSFNDRIVVVDANP